ncbi:Dephospho-CoA kinase domain-containing protein [Morella rubra]|uniref:Dephospho-CoA kinase domain-containing protein n=1 Tax=Morella rubra TaxID=262757 RepID=A0A6A1V5R7_9ROSI|nr:Dephospho-CoA kinase domain-containing protein [Morella rubra]
MAYPPSTRTYIVARDVLKKGTDGWEKVVAAFGQDILQADLGEVDRTRLGQIVFSDPAKRQLLNRLLAPYISCGIFWEILKLLFLITLCYLSLRWTSGRSPLNRITRGLE